MLDIPEWYLGVDFLHEFCMMWIMIVFVVNGSVMDKFLQYRIIVSDEVVAAMGRSNHRNMVGFG